MSVDHDSGAGGRAEMRRVQFNLRLRPEMHAAVRAVARESGRSLNGEMERRLRKSLDADPILDRLETLQMLMGDLQQEVRVLGDRLPLTGDGEQRTGTATTPPCAPTCGSTENGRRAAEDGDPCPACGRPQRALTNAERQKRHRERMKHVPKEG